jgi:Spy/CpxP family protein refolding chaperone
MKRNLILSIIASGATLALVPGLQAQDAGTAPAAPAPATTGTDTGGHPGHHGDMLARLTKQLDLTDDQQAKIKPILETFHSQMQSVHQDSSLSQEDRRSKMKDARETMNSQINAVLTPDQQTKFAAMQAKMHDHHHGGEAGSPPAAAPSATP